MPVIDYIIDLRKQAGIHWTWESLNGDYITPAGTNVDVNMGVERWEKQIEAEYIQLPLEISSIRYTVADSMRLSVTERVFQRPVITFQVRRERGIAGGSWVQNSLTSEFEFEGYDPIKLTTIKIGMEWQMVLKELVIASNFRQATLSSNKKTISGSTQRTLLPIIFNLSLKSIAGSYTIPTIELEDTIAIEP